MIFQKNDSLNDPIAALQKNLKGLPEQIEAVTSLSPLTVVSAGAGTGERPRLFPSVLPGYLLKTRIAG